MWFKSHVVIKDQIKSTSKFQKNNNWYVTTLQREGRLTLMHVNKFFQFRLKGVTDRKPILPFRYLVAAGDAGAGDADDADAGASRLLDSRRLSSPWCGDTLPPNICCSHENIDKYFQIHICSPLKSVSSGKILTNISRSISAALTKSISSHICSSQENAKFDQSHNLRKGLIHSSSMSWWTYFLTMFVMTSLHSAWRWWHCWW